MENFFHPRKKGFLSVIFWVLLATGARAEIVNELPTKEKVVALTFDACETKTPSYFDEKILNYLLEHHLPFTVFISGKFAKRNKEQLSKLAQLDFIEIENHSLTHPQHLERLDVDRVRKEVLENEQLLLEITNRKTKFLDFPREITTARHSP
jgi:peptidoglycan-N-acetylglucosamine deacetylase